MTKKTIVQNGDPVLRQRASEVSLDAISTKEIQDILKDMSSSLAACSDGVAIAAPQIGVPLRIFVVSGKVFEMRKKDGKKYPDKVFINPVFLKLSTKKAVLDEGCLSVRWIYGKIKRSEKATVEAYDEKGEKFTMSGSGLLAQIFQHETDHLDGTLFIDKATDLEEIKPEDNE
ncbi:MAG TPA: peptide deformylase [Candidatus Paceibacterota bacterium]|nr:peptide deformylase [Candidatus Paceibacterota bacterium]